MIDQAIIDRLNSQMEQRQNASVIIKSIPKHLKQRNYIMNQAKFEYSQEAPDRLAKRIRWFQKKCGVGLIISHTNRNSRDKAQPMTFLEIGTVLGLSDKTAHEIYKTAIRKLQEELIGYGMGNTLLDLLRDGREENYTGDV